MIFILITGNPIVITNLENKASRKTTFQHVNIKKHGLRLLTDTVSLGLNEMFTCFNQITSERNINTTHLTLPYFCVVLSTKRVPSFFIFV